MEYDPGKLYLITVTKKSVTNCSFIASGSKDGSDNIGWKPLALMEAGHASMVTDAKYLWNVTKVPGTEIKIVELDSSTLADFFLHWSRHTYDTIRSWCEYLESHVQLSEKCKNMVAECAKPYLQTDPLKIKKVMELLKSGANPVEVGRKEKPGSTALYVCVTYGRSCSPARLSEIISYLESSGKTSMSKIDAFMRS